MRFWETRVTLTATFLLPTLSVNSSKSAAAYELFQCVWPFCEVGGQMVNLSRLVKILYSYRKFRTSKHSDPLSVYAIKYSRMEQVKFVEESL